MNHSMTYTEKQLKYLLSDIWHLLSPNNSDKYGYLTGEDLGLKPSSVEQTRFDYSLLSKFLNKNFKEEEKEGGPLKILKNIEDKKKNN